MGGGHRESGQAFPIYVVAVAGLLFLALAFFAVGQASASRNGAQTAADAAALAAAQTYRDHLRTGIADAIEQGGSLSDVLQGILGDTSSSCADAQWYASRNGADASCGPEFGPTRFAVHVTTRKPVGRSLVAITSSAHATADAVAVVKPRCTAKSASAEDPKADDSESRARREKGKTPPLVELTCDGRDWTVDPEKIHLLPDAADLFSVELAH
ncbi:pilus assembly protein TadG-related protein [Streptomyces sp. NPDC059740]|uniref:pilus assembly protein TadG-related protein n=1 Tax=Streptomyces sp. NPDC059740 TaxID=3346926 RepID=UPI003654E606